MVSRRQLIAVLASLATASSTEVLAAAEHPSVTYMKQVGKDMLNAHRQGTVSAFMRAIQRHGDIPGISEYSLGNYGSKLPSASRAKYYKAVATFISRYFADQSRDFRVAKYEIGGSSARGEKEIVVSSKVFLLSGETYSVNWLLVWKGGRYRVSDAKVLGFSMTYQQRRLFTSFLDKRDGDVKQLIAALDP
jgi:phospholipid transport system substrate-binding protein